MIPPPVKQVWQQSIAQVGVAVLAMLAMIPRESAADESQPPTIAIIIDDMGNHWRQAERLIDLPYPMTLSFLPHRKHTQALARKAFRKNKEIMLHAPMENTLGLALGPGALTSSMTEPEIKESLRESLRSVPYVQGVNNHMGSQLTQQFKQMNWVMEELFRYPLYFVDSRTIADSVAAKVSQVHHIPTMSRDIFLDHIQEREAIHAQFQLLIQKAREKGFAIAIGHPHEVTVTYLEEALKNLDEEGISIATVSGIWSIASNGMPMFQNADKRLVIEHLIARRDALNNAPATP
jgi:hypothetical protein